MTLMKREIHFCFSIFIIVPHNIYFSLLCCPNYLPYQSVVLTSFLNQSSMPTVHNAVGASYIFSFCSALLATETSYGGRGGGVIECLSAVTATITYWGLYIVTTDNIAECLYFQQINISPPLYLFCQNIFFQIFKKESLR